ncbi:MAG: hypothetical protein ACOYMD_00990 [Paludibacter sp.]
MKILVLYQFNNHNQTVDLLCTHLYSKGVLCDSFNITSFRFFSKSKSDYPLLIKILNPLMFIPKLRGLLISLFRNKIIIKLSKNYTIIDINFFSEIYDTLIPVFKEENKIVKTTIWGSDFYRVDAHRVEVQRKLYKNVDCIQVASQRMLEDFSKKYPEQKSKITLAHFGNNMFDSIENQLLKNDSFECKKGFGLPTDKIIIVCATNGSEGQQHEFMLESIKNLSTEIKNELFIILPMAYGGGLEYQNKIKNSITQLNIPYKILFSKLSVRDLSKLRIITDIIITIQKSDAFSAAIQEHLFAGSFLIAGDWLPYDIFQERGIFYTKTNLKNLTFSISEAYFKMESIKIACKENKLLINNLSSWKNSVNDWIEIYNQLSKKQ